MGATDASPSVSPSARQQSQLVLPSTAAIPKIRIPGDLSTGD